MTLPGPLACELVLMRTTRLPRGSSLELGGRRACKAGRASLFGCLEDVDGIAIQRGTRGLSLTRSTSAPTMASDTPNRLPGAAYARFNMNDIERFKAVCAGERPDYVPIFGFRGAPGMSQGAMRKTHERLVETGMPSWVDGLPLPR